MNIETILRKHALPSHLLSTKSVKKDLLADLTHQKKFTSQLYGVLFGAICLVSVIGIGALFTDVVKNESFRTGILAGAGVGLPFMLEWMRRIVREWSQTILLITLISHSDEDAIQALIKKLQTKILY